MEPHSKRRRVSSYPDPSLDLHELRARNALKLKSTFETIFEKYSQDFSGVGDEIDLETGKIVVNNGHLLGMRDEVDVGYDQDDTEEDELANDLLSDIGQEDPRVEHIELGLDPRSEEQEQPTAFADPKASHSVMDDVDSLMGDVQEDGLLPSEANSIGVVIDQHLDSEPGISRRDLGSMVANAHLLPPNISSSRSYGDRVISQSGVIGPDRYDSVVEPAWHAPPLPNTSVRSGTRAISTSFSGRKAIGHLRSLSPSRGSLWAPERTLDRQKKDSRGTRLPKLVSTYGATVGRSPRGELEMASIWLSTPSRRRGTLSSPPASACSANTKRRHHRSSPMTGTRFLDDSSSRTHGDEFWSAATLPGIATVQDDQWLQELIANSLLPSGQHVEQSPATPARIPPHRAKNITPSGEVSGESATDELQEDGVTAVRLDTESDLILDVTYDTIEIKGEPLERPLVTTTKENAAPKTTVKPSSVAVQQLPHHSGVADAVVPRLISPVQPKLNSTNRISKHKIRVKQSKGSNAKTYSAKQRSRSIPSTPFGSQRHPGKSSKPIPAMSLTSMLGYDSEEDELSRPEKTIGTSKNEPVTTPLSTARKCGILGFKCTRSVCLRCA